MKERNRFDALAEELAAAEEKPEAGEAPSVKAAKNRKKLSDVLTEVGRARFDKLVDGYKTVNEKRMEIGLPPVTVVAASWDDDLPEDFDAETGSEYAARYAFPPPPQPEAKKKKGRPKSSGRPRADTNAYLSAMGQMWPVLEFSMSTQTPDATFRDPFGERLDRNLNILHVIIRLASRIDEKTLRLGEPALVVMRGDAEPNYYRLEIRDWKMTVSGGSTTSTIYEIDAYARQLQ